MLSVSKLRKGFPFEWLLEKKRPLGAVGFGGFKPLAKFRSFDKAEPNAQFRGKYILTV
jgi:hypothetical protein